MNFDFFKRKINDKCTRILEKYLKPNKKKFLSLNNPFKKWDQVYSYVTLHLSTAFEALCEHTEDHTKKVFNGKEGSK